MRRQLVAVTLAVTSMIAIAFVVPLAVLIRDTAAARADRQARDVTASLVPALLTGDRDVIEVALSGVDGAVTTAIVFEDGARLGPELPSGVDLGPARDGAASRVPTAGGVAFVTPVIVPGRDTSVVVVTVSDDLRSLGVARAWAALVALGVALVAGAAVLADRLGRSVTRPAAGVAATARRLAAGDGDARAEVEGPDEVADIGRALNSLADRIDDLRRVERESVADLSHRLRTPMTALRLDVEAVSDVSERARLLTGLDGVERQLDQLIREARREGDRAVGPRSCDAVSIARERHEFWEALAAEQGRAVTFDANVDAALVPLGADDLRDAVDALVGNVFSHTPDGTAYVISLKATGDTVVLLVADAGPGWPSTPVDGRGVVGGDRIGSTGLGLDIATRVAASAGGGLRRRDASPGAVVELRVPRLAEVVPR